MNTNTPDSTPHGKIIRSRITADNKLSAYSDLVREHLIFSASRSPQDYPPQGWLPANNDAIQIAAYYSEQWNDYRIVLFKVIGPELVKTENPKIVTVEIYEIADLFDYAEKPNVVRLLHLNQDRPLLVQYSIPDMSFDNNGTVELDLKRLVGDFPRLIERIADVINFLGEVVIAGVENQ